MLIAIVALCVFSFLGEDIFLAYIQSASQLMSVVYLNLNRELSRPAGCLLELVQPLYGLADSGDHWDAIIKNEHFIIRHETIFQARQMYAKRTTENIRG